MDRFSRTIFAYDISAFTKFARNWRHESPGGRFLLPFQSVDNARFNYSTIMCTNEYTQRRTLRRGVECPSSLSSFFSFFVLFLLPIYTTLLYESMRNIWHDRITLKGTRWWCAHASPVMSPVVRCTRWVHRARYRWYIAENAVTSLPFSARRDLDLLCSIKRGWAEPKESIRYRRRKLQRKCCVANGYYNNINITYVFGSRHRDEK